LTCISHQIEGSVAILTVDNPPQNRFTQEMFDELGETIAAVEEALGFARQMATGPTRAHVAHKALLRIWATGGVAAADAALLDIAMPLFESDDVKLALPAAVEAVRNSRPRPSFPFSGR